MFNISKGNILFELCEFTFLFLEAFRLVQYAKIF